MILAIVIFAAIIFAASKLGSTLEHRAAWHGVKGWLNVTPVGDDRRGGWNPGRDREVGSERVGLFERLFYVSSILWFFIVAIELARIYWLGLACSHERQTFPIVAATNEKPPRR